MGSGGLAVDAMAIGCLGVERRVERFFSYLAIFLVTPYRCVCQSDYQFQVCSGDKKNKSVPYNYNYNLRSTGLRARFAPKRARPVVCFGDMKE